MSEAERRVALKQGIRAIWERTRDLTMDRVATLEAVARNVQEGTLTTEMRAEAERTAHKLAGSLGTFGMGGASIAARQFEELLRGTDPLDAESCADLARAIRTDIESQA